MHWIETTSATSSPSTTTPRRVSCTSTTTTATVPTRRSPGTTSSSSTNPNPSRSHRPPPRHFTRLADAVADAATGLGDRAVRLRCRTRRRRLVPACRPRRRRPRRPPTALHPTRLADHLARPPTRRRPGAAVWDDTTSRIAHHRLLHDIPDDIAGLGPRPNDADTAQQWQQLMLRTLEDRCWLTDRHHQPDTPLIVRSPAELVERRTELEQLMQTAPPDQRTFIERLTHADLGPGELHDQLLAATRAKTPDGTGSPPTGPTSSSSNRSTPSSPPNPHSPTGPPHNPNPYARCSTHSGSSPPPPTAARNAASPRSTNKPSPTTLWDDSKQRLRQLNDSSPPGPPTDAERDAVAAAIDTARIELRDARQEQRIERVFARYIPDTTDDARSTRITPSPTTPSPTHPLGDRPPAPSPRQRPTPRPTRRPRHPDRPRRRPPRPPRPPPPGLAKPPPRPIEGTRPVHRDRVATRVVIRDVTGSP